MGRNIFILGDSYSTFKGYIPDGYLSYYPYSQPGAENDVEDVSDTWWYRFGEETGGKIVQNNSWSGSTVCYTGYEGRDCSGSSSFIARLNKLIGDGFFEKNSIDLFIIFGGTNDSWAGAPLGKTKYSDFKKEDLYSVLPAVCYLIKTVKEKTGAGEILFVINSGIKSEIIQGTEEACVKYGVKYVRISDATDKLEGHPAKKGMTEIKEQIKSAVEQK